MVGVDVDANENEDLVRRQRRNDIWSSSSEHCAGPFPYQVFMDNQALVVEEYDHSWAHLSKRETAS
jgi:hypothetical protein